jgi:uncharacterized RDD family membrane protein YckC
MPTTESSVPPILARVTGCAPAPMGWRLLALLLDYVLCWAATMLIVTRLVLPQDIPNWMDVVQHQSDTMMTEVQKASEQNRMPDLVLEPDIEPVLTDALETFFFVYLVYFTGSELALQGSTLGKRVFRLRTVQWTGNSPPHLAETLARGLIKSASLVWWWPFLVVNALPLFLPRRRRAFHDYVARTMVTGDPPPPPPTHEPVLAHDDF